LIKIYDIDSDYKQYFKKADIATGGRRKKKMLKKKSFIINHPFF
jgi:hypothetical protein